MITIAAWIPVTVLYILGLIALLWWEARASGDWYDFSTPVLGCGGMLVLTIAYLIFWVIYK